jgi:hypothetical protein
MFYATPGIGKDEREWPMVYWVVTGLLTWYVFSIVFGRLYTAMHSFTDCAMGVVMGAGIWWVHDGYWGLGAGALVEDIVERSGTICA